jgi:hypothetical protein
LQKQIAGWIILTEEAYWTDVFPVPNF